MNRNAPARPPIAALTLALLIGGALAACNDDPRFELADLGPPPDGGTAEVAVDGGGSTDLPPTWHADIRPIVASRCARCHGPDDVSGLDLTAADPYVAGAPPWWAASVVDHVVDRSMPPALPDPSCRAVEGLDRLSAAQIALFTRWKSTGYPLGIRDDYIPLDGFVPASPPPGPADRRLDPGAAYIPAFDDGDDTRCLILDAAFEAEAAVYAVAIEPGDGRMLRQARLYAVDPVFADPLADLDLAAPGVGYPCRGGPGVAGHRLLGAWLPDDGPLVLPPDHAFVLPAGTRLVLEARYTAAALPPAAPVPAERTAVALWTLPDDEPPTDEVEAVAFTVPGVQVPAGASGLEEGRDFRLGVDALVIGATARMESRGAALSVELARAGAAPRCVLDLPRFDPGAVDVWTFPPEQWVPISGEDTLRLRCTYGDSPSAAGPEDEACEATLLIARPRDAVVRRPQCATFAPCAAACLDSPDEDCFARCHAAGERACPECLLRATGLCGRAACEAEVQALGECSGACEGPDLGCLIERCGAPFTALAGCVVPTLVDGQCGDEYATCGVRFGP